MIWPIECSDERTRAMLERALEDGPEREAMGETHGQVSLDRAPHQELRKHYGFSVASWESGHVEWREATA